MNTRLYSMMHKLAAINMSKLIDAIDPARAAAKNVLMHNDPEKMSKMIDALKREGKFDEFLEKLPEDHFKRFVSKANYNSRLTDEDFKKIDQAISARNTKKDAFHYDSAPGTGSGGSTGSSSPIIGSGSTSGSKGSSTGSSTSGDTGSSSPIIGSGSTSGSKGSSTSGSSIDSKGGGDTSGISIDSKGGDTSGSSIDSSPIIGSGSTSEHKDYKPYLVGGGIATAGAIGIGLRHRKDRENAR